MTVAVTATATATATLAAKNINGKVSHIFLPSSFFRIFFADGTVCNDRSESTRQVVSKSTTCHTSRQLQLYKTLKEIESEKIKARIGNGDSENAKRSKTSAGEQKNSLGAIFLSVNVTVCLLYFF